MRYSYERVLFHLATNFRPETSKKAELPTGCNPHSTSSEGVPGFGVRTAGPQEDACSAVKDVWLPQPARRA